MDQRAGNNCRFFEEVVRELSPLCAGCFLAAATSVLIEEEKQQLLLATDFDSRHIPHAALCEKKDYQSWRRFFRD